MSEEIIIRQPASESFTYLDPQYRKEHVIAVIDCSKKDKRYDEKAKAEKDHATFRAVDLDGERELITFADNHDGIVRNINPGDVGVLIGRITTVKTKSDNDFYVLGEHTEADVKRFHEWYADWKAGKPTATGWKTARELKNSGTTPTPPTPVPTPTPTPAPTPAPAPVGNGEIDITKLDPTTLQLVLAQLQAAGKS